MGRILFQVGDWVKIVEPNLKHLLGKTYTIVDISDDPCKLNNITLEDINGDKIYVSSGDIGFFEGNERKMKTVEQYKSEIIALVRAMSEEHGMSVSSLTVDVVNSVMESGKEFARSYEVRIDA